MRSAIYHVRVGFWKTFSFWLKDTLQSRGSSVKPDSSLSRTIEDASHVRGGGGQDGGFTSSEETLRIAVEGHENYQKSFKKNR